MRGRSITFLAGTMLTVFGASGAPQIILDSGRLDYVAFPKAQVEKLNSGWRAEGTAFVRPFRRVASGVVRYRGSFALPAGVTARLTFVDAVGGVLASEQIVEGSNVTVRGTFVQSGDLAALRLEPSREISPKGVFVHPLRVTVGWAVDEPFTCLKEGAPPRDWKCTGAKVMDLSYSGCTVKDGKKGFDRPCSDAVLEIAPGGVAEPAASPELLSDSYAFEFDARVEAGTRLSAAGVDLNALYRFTPGIWYHFRFEVSRGRARVRLNGRIIAERVKVAGLALANRSSSSALLVDDVKAFALVSPDDYPPAPVRPRGEEKWDVMLNVCPLWYNGYHAGWSCIEHGNGPKPVLGYYDEGVPETADWEIKYMVEHGIDVQAFCWYPETHDGPIRHPRNEFHLRDGFKNARYSDAMKYCLIWEIENSGRPHSLEAWKKNYVPYLIEHHFKDPRYYVVDGKPVMMVFGAWNFIDATAFGSAEATRAAFDCLGGELKKLGFRGVLPVFSHGNSHEPFVAACGFEAAAPYNYGSEGWKVETQKARNQARAEGATVFEIPAVSVGFNSEPWHGKRYPMMSPDDFVASLKWLRDEFMPSQKHADGWQSRVVLLSTWNEYGEGTYLMPTEDERGFGYLDAVRSVFTDEKPDSALNLKPAPAQRSRICNLYPQDVSDKARQGN